MKDWKNRIIDIYGTKYRIEYVPKVLKVDEDRNAFGLTNSEKHLIQVALADEDGERFNDEEILLTTLHELMHAIFTEGCYLHTNEDEPLVEWTAKCLRNLITQKILQWNT